MKHNKQTDHFDDTINVHRMVQQGWLM